MKKLYQLTGLIEENMIPAKNITDKNFTFTSLYIFSSNPEHMRVMLLTTHLNKFYNLKLKSEMKLMI